MDSHVHTSTPFHLQPHTDKTHIHTFTAVSTSGGSFGFLAASSLTRTILSIMSANSSSSPPPPRSEPRSAFLRWPECRPPFRTTRTHTHTHTIRFLQTCDLYTIRMRNMIQGACLVWYSVALAHSRHNHAAPRVATADARGPARCQPLRAPPLHSVLSFLFTLSTEASLGYFSTVNSVNPNCSLFTIWRTNRSRRLTLTVSVGVGNISVLEMKGSLASKSNAEAAGVEVQRLPDAEMGPPTHRSVLCPQWRVTILGTICLPVAGPNISVTDMLET